jgi:DNA-binding transcriptional regulator YiaG
MDGNDLREQREEPGFDHEALARELEIPTATIRRWEQMGDADIPNSRMLQLALEALQGRRILKNRTRR